jgi:hypothetical protein
MSRFAIVVTLTSLIHSVSSFGWQLSDPNAIKTLFHKSKIDQPIIDVDGLTIARMAIKEQVNESRWNLNKGNKDNISVLTPKDNDHSVDQVKILRDPVTSAILAVRADLKSGPASGHMWNGVYNSVANPNEKVVATYYMKDSLVQDFGDKAEGVNKGLCIELRKNSADLNNCAKKLNEFSTKIIDASPEDQKALKELSEESGKPVKNIIASLPKKIWDAYAMCNRLDSYSSLEDSTILHTPVAKKANSATAVKTK